MNGITQPTKATAGQMKQISRLAADAVEKVLTESDLNKDELQLVIEDGDKFVRAIRDAASKTMTTLSIGYFSGYKPRSISEQIKRLRELFPSLGTADELIADGALPLEAEGWFAIPRWEKVAPHYDEAVQVVLKMLKATRRDIFQSRFKDDELDSIHLRQANRSVEAWGILANNQRESDIIIIPAQFGLRHRRLSYHDARGNFVSGEFGLGAFAVGIMLLTHPERLMHRKDLGVNCAGDDHVSLPSTRLRGRNVTVFVFDDYERFDIGSMKFDIGDRDHYDYRRFGSASGFVTSCL
ncbi:MAG: hypothetical protein AAB388_04875 [Patescibacteria group bacterium]